MSKNADGNFLSEAMNTACSYFDFHTFANMARRAIYSSHFVLHNKMSMGGCVVAFLSKSDMDV